VSLPIFEGFGIAQVHGIAETHAPLILHKNSLQLVITILKGSELKGALSSLLGIRVAVYALPMRL
jgi:hypothetical protein